MVDKIQPLNLALNEFRRILERRERASREVADRSTATRYRQAANEEAALFGGLRELLDELELARTRLQRDPTRPIKRFRQPATRVALVVSGGALTQVVANGQQIEVVLIDYDAEGFDHVVPIPQGDGSSWEARISRPDVDVDPHRVDGLFGAFQPAAEPEVCADGPTPTV